MGARADCGTVRRSFTRQEGAEVEVGRATGSRQIDLLQDLLPHIAAVAHRFQCPVHNELAVGLHRHIRLHPSKQDCSGINNSTRALENAVNGADTVVIRV